MFTRYFYVFISINKKQRELTANLAISACIRGYFSIFLSFARIICLFQGFTHV